jgi:hypothetical protein
LTEPCCEVLTVGLWFDGVLFEGAAIDVVGSSLGLLLRLSPGNAPAAAIPPNARAQMTALNASAERRVMEKRGALRRLTGAIVGDVAPQSQHPRFDLVASLQSLHRTLSGLTIR